MFTLVSQEVDDIAKLELEGPTLKLGTGTDSTETEVAVVTGTPPAAEDQETPPVPFQESLFYDGYARNPTYIDQYERLPLTVKEGELKAEVFDLQDPARLLSYNKLLGDATNPYSPRALILNRETITHKGSWKVLVHYKDLWYKILNR